MTYGANPSDANGAPGENDPLPPAHPSIDRVIEVRLRLPAEWIRSSNRDRVGSNSERLAGRLVVFLPGGRDVPLYRRRTA